MDRQMTASVTEKDDFMESVAEDSRKIKQSQEIVPTRHLNRITGNKENNNFVNCYFFTNFTTLR